jgi:ribonuclease-3
VSDRVVPDLADLEATVGYRFTDRELLAQAVRHASWCHQQVPRPTDNERLEFLGDAVLYLVIGHRAVVRFPQYPEGDLSRIRQQIIREDTLADAAREIGLGAHLLLDHNLDVNQGGRDKPRILADAFEALLGAVYLDGGLAAAEQVIDHLLGARLAATGPRDLRDFKTRLKEAAEARGLPTPRYHVIEAVGPEHLKEFVVSVDLGADELGRGRGSTQRAAEQRAAEQAIGAVER